MTWNFFYLNMYGKKYIEKAKNTLQGVPKKEFVFQNVQILVDKNFLKLTILSSGKVENVCKFFLSVPLCQRKCQEGKESNAGCSKKRIFLKFC